VHSAPEEQIEILLQNLTRSELLVNQARKEGIEVSDSRQDSLVAAVRDGVRGVAREMGFLGLTRQQGESLDEAAARAVREVLEEVVQGIRQVFPLGTVSFALRKQFGARINRDAFATTVERITALRAEAPPQAPTLQPGAEPSPDTSDPGDAPGGGGGADPGDPEPPAPGAGGSSQGEDRG